MRLVAFAAFLAAGLTAVLTGAALAASPVCEDLHRQYAAATSGGGGNAAAISRQIAAYQNAARQHACGPRFFFGPRPSPACPQIMGTLAQLQRQLAMAGGGQVASGGHSPAQLRQWMAQYGCAVPGRQAAGATRWTAGDRTLCVRLCDGYYFPISTGGVRRDRVKVDAEACQSMFAAPDQATLFLQRDRDDVSTAVSVDGKMRYGDQPFALKYRETFDAACHAQLKTGISALADRYMTALRSLPQKPRTKAQLRDAAGPVAWPLPNLAPPAQGEDPETAIMRSAGLSLAPQVADEDADPPGIRMVGNRYYRVLYDPTLPPIEMVEHRPPLGFDLIGNAMLGQETESATQ